MPKLCLLPFPFLSFNPISPFSANGPN